MLSDHNMDGLITIFFTLDTLYPLLFPLNFPYRILTFILLALLRVDSGISTELSCSFEELGGLDQR